MMHDGNNWTTNGRNSCYISISILSASAPEAILLSSVKQTDLICFTPRIHTWMINRSTPTLVDHVAVGESILHTWTTC